MSDRLMSESAINTTKMPAEKMLGERTFNLAEWLDGRGQATRTVRIYGALELFGERESLGYELEAARAAKDTEAVASLKKRIDELTVRMEEDAMDFKLQGLTQSKRKELIDALEESSEEDPDVLAMMMLAQYIVEPAGVTPEQLLALGEWDFVQTNELVTAMNQLNQNVPNIGASRPF